jgi:hypothetical protein
VDRLQVSPDLVFPGTDLTEYREYRDRRMCERVGAPTPIELVDAMYEFLDWKKDDD